MRIAQSAFLAAILTAVSACDGGSTSETASQPLAVAPSSGHEVEPSGALEQASFCAQPTGPEPKAAGAAYTDGVCPRPKGDPVDIFVWAAPQLTSINLSQSTLTLDRWGDAATIAAKPVDQNGNDLSGATIVWLSADDTIAAVDNGGNVTSWLGGNIDLTVEASLDGVTVADTVAVTVAIQQNRNCTVPTEFPVQGPVAPPSQWLPRTVQTLAFPDTTLPGPLHMGIPLVLDADRDGDPDLLTLTNTPENQGIGVPIDTAHAVWLNDGNANFTNGTDAILGQNEIPWSAPRNIGYADFDADGFRDIMVFQQGWEEAINCEVPGGCPGGPNLLFFPQPGGLSDSAPTRLDPYDLAEFTHSGAVDDVDCDGDIDILEAQWGVGGHHLQLNSGAGTFQAIDSQLPLETFTTVGISGTAMCDLDRDGDPDLVTVDGTLGVVYPARISVNNGFGHFRMLDETVLPALDPDDGADCTDLDLNGYPDIVLGDNEALLNQGDMVFVLDTSIPYTTSRSGLGIVDLNNDGWPELAPTDGDVFWNTGNGVFSAAPVPAACCSHQPTIADFNKDGWPDIYVHMAKEPGGNNLIYLNVPASGSIKRVYATSSLYTADLGGLAGADAICQQHASDAGLPGSYVAFLSDSSIDAPSRISHGEYRRAVDNALIASSKYELVLAQLTNSVAKDENDVTIPDVSKRVRTGTDFDGYRHQDTGIGFCSDWTRATDEDPGLAANGLVEQTGTQWMYQDGQEGNCSEPQRLYCFQQ